MTIQDSFSSLVRPENFDTVEEEALRVNGLSIEKLREAPCIEVVFKSWADWIEKYNINKNKNSFGAPTAVHFNGDNYDMPILNRYCERFGEKYWDKTWSSQKLFNPIYSIDVSKHMWFWMRENEEMKNLKLTTILEYMGVSKEEIEKDSHGALWDATKTAEIAIRLIKLSKYLTGINTTTGKRKLNFKDTLKK
jgi:DNA polymerase III epsilon subunit-like protein